MRPDWRPTDTLLRAALVSLALLLVAVLTGRPDVLVLAVPLLVCATAAVARRPTSVPAPTTRLLHTSVREGEGTIVRADIRGADDVEHMVVALSPHRWMACRPPSGVLGQAVSPSRAHLSLDIPVASTRWGRRPVGDGLVAATSSWSGFRCGPFPVDPSMLTTLPMPGRFDTRAPAPHPIGLVGANPARRAGAGNEFAGIRPFYAGDRLRRVHWRVSLRTGSLHVTSTVAEEDSSVLLVVDAGVEIGVGGGVRGPSSSLDVAVRAAGAIAEHYLRRGDRVALRVLGSTDRNVLRMAAGRTQLRRVLDTLARIVPGERRDVDPSGMHFGASAGTIVVVLSPMLSEQAIATTVTLARRGLSVVVVDTIPDGLDLGEDDRLLRLAWRMRLLERDGLLGKVRQAGIPVVSWAGPGTLDEVLRMLGRRASLPRMVRR